jgi:hypothetical protein
MSFCFCLLYNNWLCFVFQLSTHIYLSTSSPEQTRIFDRFSFETNMTTTMTSSSSSIEDQDNTSSIKIDPGTVNNKFCLQKATKSLNVTCYGSSSSKTPIRYLEEARSLGYMLAQRGHVCINGMYNIRFMSVPFFLVDFISSFSPTMTTIVVSNGAITGSFSSSSFS